jgi:hypothetical protein
MVQSVEPKEKKALHGVNRMLSSGELSFEDDYTPRSILLTGGCGFIGSHVATLLTTKYPAYKVRVPYIDFSLVEICFAFKAFVLPSSVKMRVRVSCCAFARLKSDNE